MSNKPQKNSLFTSDITEFLNEFDQQPEAHSAARRAEEEKYARINQLRDEIQSTSAKDKIWSGF